MAVVEFSLGVGGHAAGGLDLIGGVGAHGPLQEGLGSLGELGALHGDHDEGALDLVSTVSHSGLGGSHTVDLHGHHGVVHSGQGGVADGVGVAGHRADHLAGGLVLVGVHAGILNAHDLLEGAAGTGGGITADDGDGGVGAAQLGPVGDLAGVDLGDLLNGQVGDGVLRVDHDGHAVQGHDVLHGALSLLLVGQSAGGQADVHGAGQDVGDAGAGAGAGVVHGHVGLDVTEGLLESGHHVGHRGGAVGVHGAADGRSLAAGGVIGAAGIILSRVVGGIAGGVVGGVAGVVAAAGTAGQQGRHHHGGHHERKKLFHLKCPF